MNNTIIISGKAGSGKDTLASFMKEELEKHNKRVLVIHYGDAVKWVLKEFFNWDGKKDAVGRTMLQHIGTDVVRAQYPNFWTGIVVGLIKAFEPYSDFDVALVPDARFPNEVDIALETLNNCVTVRINRSNEDGTEWINPNLTEVQRKHPSETSLDCYAFDYVVHNDEGLDTLRESAITILKDLELI
jgi:hypothetical protein